MEKWTKKMGIKPGVASRPWIIVPLAAACHITYGLSILFHPSVEHITAVHVVTDYFGYAAWAILLFAGLFSLIPILIEQPPWAIQIFLWPQQFVLCLMAYGAIVASISGDYPDGTPKGDSLFIFNDQCWAIYLTIAHLAATIRNSRFSK